MKLVFYKKNEHLIVTSNKCDLNILNSMTDKVKYIRENIIPDYTEEDYVISSNKIIKHYKIVNNKVVEKSDYEKKIEGIIPLSDGEYIEDNAILSVLSNPNFLRPIWNIETKEWEESATHEELFSKHAERILLATEKVLLEGFIFTDNSGKEHIQSIDTENITFLNSERNSIIDGNDTEIEWRFDLLGQDKIILTLEEINRINKEGTEFTRSVFSVRDAMVLSTNYYETYTDFVEELSKLDTKSLSVMLMKQNEGSESSGV